MEQDFLELYHTRLRKVLKKVTWEEFRVLVLGLLNPHPYVYPGDKQAVVIPRTRVGRFLKG